MRRMVFAVVLLAAAATAHAIDTRTRPLRLVLLAQPAAHDAFRDRLKSELLTLGYEVADSAETIRDLGRENVPGDYYIEILGAGGGTRTVAGVGAGPVDVGIGVNHAAASVNVYDGRSLDLVDAIDLRKRSTSVSALGVSVGSRPVWAAISLPIFEWSQYRSAMRKLARDAAREIDQVVRH